MFSRLSLRTVSAGCSLALAAGLGAVPLAATPALAADTVSIAEIQGNGQTTPLSNQTVTTRGVVTAVYSTGGLNGYYIQTAGSGGAEDATPGASDGIFVYSPQTVSQVKKGDYVEVTGKVSEYYEQTQITVTSGNLTQLSEDFAPVQPITGAFPENEIDREAIEGMLVQPTGDITITDNYNTNRYGEIGLVNGTEPLRTATDVVAPGEEAVAYEAVNAERFFALDDGATSDYTRGGSNIPLPYLSGNNPARVGASVSFDEPVVATYSRDLWRLQPTEPITGDNEAELAPAHWTATREAAPEEVGGEVSIASFNVLNYFSTTGDTLAGCRFYTDREKNPISVSGGCDARGAANQENLQRQQAKIVEAINTLNASVISLEEIENSAAFGKDRDEALNHLVDGLNAAAGYTKWQAVQSPEALPESEDVIRTAFIYQPDQVKPLGESTIYSGSDAFSNARLPLAQAFTLADADEDDESFVAIVNHFKSKGSGSGEGNQDSGDGQGASNASRVAQAEALSDFASQQAQAHQTENVVLLGDFNSYTREDPMQVLYGAGFTNIGDYYDAGNTYLFGGRVGSLDHVLVSPEFLDNTTGADVWNINAFESVGLEYSRYNNNVTNLYSQTPYRSSDHDPKLMGFNLRVESPEEQPDEQDGGSTVPPAHAKNNERGKGNNGQGNDFAKKSTLPPGQAKKN